MPAANIIDTIHESVPAFGVEPHHRQVSIVIDYGVGNIDLEPMLIGYIPLPRILLRKELVEVDVGHDGLERVFVSAWLIRSIQVVNLLIQLLVVLNALLVQLPPPLLWIFPTGEEGFCSVLELGLGYFHNKTLNGN